MANGDLKMTRLLLRHGATRNLHPISDKFEMANADPVILAQIRSLDMMKLPVNQKSHVSPIAIKAAVQARWMAGIDFLLSINPSCISTTEVKTAWSDAVVSATKEKSLELMRSWVKEKSPVSVKAVKAAVDAPWMEGLSIFLSLNPTMSRAAGILAARSPSHTTVLEVVLKMGGDPNIEGQSPLFCTRGSGIGNECRPCEHPFECLG